MRNILQDEYFLMNFICFMRKYMRIICFFAKL